MVEFTLDGRSVSANEGELLVHAAARHGTFIPTLCHDDKLDPSWNSPVLEMRRFDDAAVLARAPELVDGELAETLGRTVARFHVGATVAPQGGGAANLKYVLDSNAAHVRALLASRHPRAHG